MRKNFLLLICSAFVLMRKFTEGVVISKNNVIKRATDEDAYNMSTQDFLDTLLKDYHGKTETTTAPTEQIKPTTAKFEEPNKFSTLPNYNIPPNSGNEVAYQPISFAPPTKSPTNNFYRIPSDGSNRQWDQTIINTNVGAHHAKQRNPFLPPVPPNHKRSDTSYFQSSTIPWRFDEGFHKDNFNIPNAKVYVFDGSGPTVHYQSSPSIQTFRINPENVANHRRSIAFNGLGDPNAFTYNNPNGHYQSSSYSYKYNSNSGPPVITQYNYDSRNGETYRVFTE